MNSIVSKIYIPSNDVFGLPQEYKGIKFYPIKVKEVEMKGKLYDLFFHPKNYIPDRAILRMSYIKFLIFVVQESMRASDPNTDVVTSLIDFLSSITHEKKVDLRYFEYPESNDPFERISLHLFIDGIEFSEQEFDNIREIVLEQNGSSIDWVEGYNPDLEKKLEFLNRNTLDTDFKDEIYSFCSLTNLSEIEVGEKTLFQFKARMEREVLIKDYNLFKPKEITGQISSKSGEELFKHYLSHIPKQSRYGTILIDEKKFLQDSGLENADADGNIS